MTPAAKRTFRRIAARCAERGDYEPLYAFIQAYDTRARAPQSAPAYDNTARINIEVAAYKALAEAEAPPEEVLMLEPLPWWRRLLARVAG